MSLVSEARNKSRHSEVLARSGKGSYLRPLAQVVKKNETKNDDDSPKNPLFLEPAVATPGGKSHVILRSAQRPRKPKLSPQLTEKLARSRKKAAVKRSFGKILTQVAIACGFISFSMGGAFYAMAVRTNQRTQLIASSTLAKTTALHSNISSETAAMRATALEKTAIYQAVGEPTTGDKKVIKRSLKQPLKTLEEQIQELEIRGVQIAAYTSKAMIGNRIVHQGERFLCGDQTLIFKGVQDSNLIFQDETGKIHSRPLRHRGKNSQNLAQS